MPPPAKRRRLSQEHIDDNDSVNENSVALSKQRTVNTPDAEPSTSNTTDLSTSKPQTTPAAMTDRLSKFAALKARATESARSNLHEAKAEAKRSAIDHEALSKLQRRAEIASNNLLKDELDEQGKGTFERKRAWDYTIEESEKWDARIARKKEAKEKSGFADFGAQAAKVYDRQIREFEAQAKKDGLDVNGSEYLQEKSKLIEQAAKSGGLEIVELDSGELVAIDRHGRFFGDDNGFQEQRPKKENIDRLVADMNKADEVRIRKAKERRAESGDPDVTYINEKNKQFNKKLSRFYDRYTTEIRESFERGTAL